MIPRPTVAPGSFPEEVGEHCGLAWDPEEEWRPVVGYEGLYSVSDQGRVKSARNGKIMSPVLNGDGYPSLKLYRAGANTRIPVHRLVARAFHGDKENALHNEVAHLDGTRSNAAAANLKWVSKAENSYHKRLHGTHQARAAHPRAVLTEANVAEIRSSEETNCALARKFGVRDAAICKIRKGQRWK